MSSPQLETGVILNSFFKNIVWAPLTYFASPADSLPDAEIDQYPRNGECDS